MLRENDFLQSFDGHQLRPLKGIAFYQPQGWSTCGAGPRRSHLAFWQKFQKNITKTSKNFLIKISKKIFYHDADHNPNFWSLPMLEVRF